MDLVVKWIHRWGILKFPNAKYWWKYFMFYVFICKCEHGSSLSISGWFREILDGPIYSNRISSVEASHHPIDGFSIVEPPKPSHDSIDGFSIAGPLFSIQAVTSLLAGKAHSHSRGHIALPLSLVGTYLEAHL